jgi:hypothetical protein
MSDQFWRIGLSPKQSNTYNDLFEVLIIYRLESINEYQAPAVW